MRRAGKTDKIGSPGHSYVRGDFQGIGWAAVDNTLQDLGTDLIVSPRDERGFDLGIVNGVQVKTTSSKIKEPAEVDGEEGWWWRDSTGDDLNAWASWGAPFFLVLHSLRTRKSYWVQVTHEKIVSTGKGSKVFVPKANGINEANRDALLAAATSKRPKIAWEGSAWNANLSVPLRDRLRYALIAPRLIAPHPNLGPQGGLDYVQGIALLAQARFRDLRNYAQAEKQPSLREARSSSWGWRLVGGLADRILEGDTARLEKLVDSAPHAWGRTAAAVMAGSAFIEAGEPQNALKLLRRVRDLDEAAPVDHGWLNLQVARALVEIGDFEPARVTAVGLQNLPAQFAEDLTASAIAGSAAVLLFNSSGLGAGDLALAISGGDTSTTWWRAQTTNQGLLSNADWGFKEWAHDTSVTIAAEDVVTNRLTASTISASHEGDQAGWRHLSGLATRIALADTDRAADPLEIAGYLTRLRHAGDEKNLVLALQRIASDGPAEALREALRRLDLARSTRTSALADLSLVEHGGDLADPATARRLVNWILKTLKDPSKFEARTSTTYLVSTKLTEALAGIVQVCGVKQRGEVAAHLVDQPATENILLARAWTQIARKLDADAWGGVTARRLLAAARRHEGNLQFVLLKIATDRGSRKAEQQLEKEAASGSIDALSALGVAPDLTPELAKAGITRAARLVRVRLRRARAGRVEFGGLDPGETLAILNAWHPSQANWKPIYDLLEEKCDLAIKARTLEALGSVIELAEDAPRKRLSKIAAGLALLPPGPRLLAEPTPDPLGPGTVVARAGGEISQDEVERRLLILLGGDARRKQWGLRLAYQLETGESVGLVLSLARDGDPLARAAAAGALTALYLDGQRTAIIEGALKDFVADPGTRVPGAVAATLEKEDPIPSVARPYLKELQKHPAMSVRQLARRALQR